MKKTYEKPFAEIVDLSPAENLNTMPADLSTGGDVGVWENLSPWDY